MLDVSLFSSKSRNKQKSSSEGLLFLSDNTPDNTLFPSRLSNSLILLSPKIVQGSRSSGIGVYEFPGQWTILFRGTGFSAVLEWWEEEWRIVWKRFRNHYLVVGDGQVDMVQVVVRFDGLNPSSMVFLCYRPHIWKEHRLDIRFPYAPTRMF